MKESPVETRLIQEVKKIGGLCKKWVCPGWSGVPDRIILLPQGQVCFVELKATDKKERRLQELRHKQLRDMGFKVYGTVDSYEKIDQIIKDILTNDVV